MSYRSALEIVRTLFNDGHIAYFAGGWVRDHLMGNTSDEIDIATSAPPEKIQQLFPKTILVGVEFGVVVVVWKGENFEVTTFRKDHPYQDGRHPTGIDFSSPEKDALRRDFTINGMFYDPLSEEIHDYVKGKEDLEQGVIRAIGDPRMRFQEDRLRMVRAVRFAARFGFEIEKETREAIIDQAGTLFPSVSIERIWQELKKMHEKGPFDTALIMLHELGLLEQIFPKLKNLSLSDLKKRIPKGRVPTILMVTQLFERDERVEMARFLKVPGSDIKLVEFASQSESLFHHSSSQWEWAHFYAHPSSSIVMTLEKSKSENDLAFHEEHERRKKELAPHIQRIQAKKPLVNAALLQAKGISPGKEMGRLLQLAEKIAIEEDLHDPESILKKLWMKN